MDDQDFKGLLCLVQLSWTILAIILSLMRAE